MEQFLTTYGPREIGDPATCHVTTLCFSVTNIITDMDSYRISNEIYARQNAKSLHKISLWTPKTVGFPHICRSFFCNRDRWFFIESLLSNNA